MYIIIYRLWINFYYILLVMIICYLFFIYINIYIYLFICLWGHQILQGRMECFVYNWDFRWVKWTHACYLTYGEFRLIYVTYVDILSYPFEFGNLAAKRLTCVSDSIQRAWQESLPTSVQVMGSGSTQGTNVGDFRAQNRADVGYKALNNDMDKGVKYKLRCSFFDAKIIRVGENVS